ncbi:MAG: TrmH family RNA methyltransferase [Myxococcota bacterium]
MKPGPHAPLNPAERRLHRLRTALDQRLGHVACAIQAVHHRHNISAILRTCDSLGLHQVHLVEGHFTPTRGATRGAEKWLDLHQHTSTSAAIEALRAQHMRIYVADLTDDSVPPEQVPIDKPVCLWFGAELAGVDPEAAKAADGVVHIPMRGLAQSLNVSVAAALALRTVAERARSELGSQALLTAEHRERVWSMWVQREEALREALAARSDSAR